MVVWSTGATNTTIINLGIGTYTVTVTDSKGCTTSTEATLNGPTPLLAKLQQQIYPVLLQQLLLR